MLQFAELNTMLKALGLRSQDYEGFRFWQWDRLDLIGLGFSSLDTQNLVNRRLWGVWQRPNAGF
jgi:hypothetical protein